MFLRRLTLENIRSITDLDIDFQVPGSNNQVRHWTCILGENGTGKSSILRSAALVLAGSDSLPELLGDPGRWIRNGTKAAKITAEVVTQDGREHHIAIELKAGSGLAETLKANAAGLSALDEALKHTKRSYFVVGYGVSRRFPGSTSEKFQSASGKPLRAQSVITLFQADASLRSLEAWAMDLHYRRGAVGLNLIRKVLNTLLPDVKFQGIDKERRQLVFKTADGLVPLAQLSDGYQSVISWYGDLLYRITEVFKDHKKPLEARGLLLLDEVDLHLHPLWQRRVADFLRQTLPNFQCIVTTHSALTAQQCGEGELYVLKRTEDAHIQLNHYEAAPNLLRVDQLLVSPVFGLETGMSVAVQEIRSSTNRSKAEMELLQKIPRPRADAETEKEKIALLKEIRSALNSKGGAKKARACFKTVQVLKMA
jgi:Sec-independent protein translocase protein TatA